jgi:hypothetical protein
MESKRELNNSSPSGNIFPSISTSFDEKTAFSGRKIQLLLNIQQI